MISKSDPDISIRHISKSTFRHRNRGRFVDEPSRYLEDVNPRILFEMYQGRCGFCGHFIDDRYHIDHIWPIWFGGTHEYLNLQCLHIECHKFKTQIEFEYKTFWERSLRMAAIQGKARAEVNFAYILNVPELMPSVQRK